MRQVLPRSALPLRKSAAEKTSRKRAPRLSVQASLFPFGTSLKLAAPEEILDTDL